MTAVAVVPAGLAEIPAGAALAAALRAFSLDSVPNDRMLGMQTAAHWRFAVVDGAGSLLSEGCLRRRPAGATRDGPPGGIVEIQIDEELLARLVEKPGEAGAWATVVAEVAVKHARYAGDAVDLDARPGDRLPSGPLRRHTEIRDRTCTFGGVCRRPAHASAQDHGHDYAAGGATVRENVGPVCAMDHLLKHRAGWEASRPGDAGTVIWRSPLGGEYSATGEFLTGPVLDPLPATEPPSGTGEPDQVSEEPILWHPSAADGTEDTDGPRAPPEQPDAPPPV